MLVLTTAEDSATQTTSVRVMRKTEPGSWLHFYEFGVFHNIFVGGVFGARLLAAVFSTSYV